ncbi:MAG: NADH-quinone oxidoreductase subunit L [Anaerolineae bacterium]
MDLNAFMSDPNNLAWLIPVGPLLAFLIITLLTNRSKLIPATSEEYGGHHPNYEGMLVPVATTRSRIVSVVVGMAGILFAWLIAVVVIGHAFAVEHLGEEVLASGLNWFDTGVTAFRMGVLVDPLTVIMLVMVPLACTMIFIYSIGYMAHDPRQSRFFSLIALFAGAMLTLVVADNLLLLFVGWEIMGLCSYMLIGFWFEKESAYKAAIKAFTTTRVADVIMLLGIAYLYAQTGTLSFRAILYDQSVLDGLAGTPAILFGGLGWSAASVIGIFLIIGTIGKSAQFPLHVWLPDAMEGPTPVSAMIHAAAMVSAGIYAVVRMYPLLSAGADPHHGILSPPMVLMAVVGAFTALFAATIAVAQNDVKKVLAYSTISQLGFMMAALGIGAYIAAAFHLITHAFFKALLFMASGSVIHGMEHGEHHVHHAHAHAHGHEHAPALPSGELAETRTRGCCRRRSGRNRARRDDGAYREARRTPRSPARPALRSAGHDEHGRAVRRTMPVTFYTFMIGGAVAGGLPPLTAGFGSSDRPGGCLERHARRLRAARAGVRFPRALAFLTAFYTMRQLGLTFWGSAHRRSEAREPGARDRLGDDDPAADHPSRCSRWSPGTCWRSPGFPAVRRDLRPERQSVPSLRRRDAGLRAGEHRLQHLPGAGVVHRRARRAVRGLPDVLAQAAGGGRA